MLMIAREFFTVFSVLAFAFIVWFAYNKRSKPTYELVGNSIIEDDDTPSPDNAQTEQVQR